MAPTSCRPIRRGVVPEAAVRQCLQERGASVCVDVLGEHQDVGLKGEHGVHERRGDRLGVGAVVQVEGGEVHQNQRMASGWAACPVEYRMDSPELPDRDGRWLILHRAEVRVGTELSIGIVMDVYIDSRRISAVFEPTVRGEGTVIVADGVLYELTASGISREVAALIEAAKST